MCIKHWIYWHGILWFSNFCWHFIFIHQKNLVSEYRLAQCFTLDMNNNSKYADRVRRWGMSFIRIYYLQHGIFIVNFEEIPRELPLEYIYCTSNFDILRKWWTGGGLVVAVMAVNPILTTRFRSASTPTRYCIIRLIVTVCLCCVRSYGWYV